MTRKAPRRSNAAARNATTARAPTVAPRKTDARREADAALNACGLSGRLVKMDAYECQDCTREYKFSLHIPREHWLRIVPEEARILCPTCMVERAGSLGGVIDVTGFIHFVSEWPDATAPYDIVTAVVAARRTI